LATVDVFLDVNILLTLSFKLPSFLPACNKFKDDAKREKVKLHLTSSVESVFDYKVTEANNLIGILLRGLVIRVSTVRTGAQDQLLEKITLTETDKSLIRAFFGEKYAAAKTELKRVRIKAVEAWVVKRFEDMIQAVGSMSLIAFTKSMLMENQDVYDKISLDKNSVIKELGVEVLPIQPSATATTAINGIVSDPEDVPHLASLVDYLSGKVTGQVAPNFAVYVTTDYGHVLAAKDQLKPLKIYAEEPIWGIDTCKTLMNDGTP
jgi:hypothetical protein